jgi:hypothetical protein
MTDNVLDGIVRRAEAPQGMIPRAGPPRVINVTFRVDDLALMHARGRAFLEGTSVNALVCRLLEDYSGIHPSPDHEVERRLPWTGRPRVRMSENSYR